jgi:hypothetical protein
MGFLGACATTESGAPGTSRKEQKRLRDQREGAAAEHALYRSLPNWRKTTYRQEELLALANPDNTAIEISLVEQRGLLLVQGAIAMEFAVATGKKSHPTPPGSFRIIDKKSDYASNLYGKIFDAEGALINSDADARTDVVPEGGRFVGAAMPYWMRLTNTGVGLHVGYVPGRPASHGCIRLPQKVAKELFALTKIGTPVVIATHFPATSQPPPKPAKRKPSAS